MKYLHSWHFWHDQPCLYRLPHVICNNKPLVRDSFNYKSLHFLHVLKRVAQWRCCVVCRWSLLCHLWPGNQQVLFNTEYIWYILLFVSHWPRFLLQNKESTHQATLWFLAIWYIVRPCMPIKAHNNLGGSLSVLSWYTNTNLKYIGTWV